MNTFERLRKFASPPRFQDEEKTRIAGILNTGALAVLVGLCALAVFRQSSGQARLVPPILAMAGIALASLLLLRRGVVAAASGILSVALLCFLLFMLVLNDGIHDTAILALPAILVLAVLVLKRRYFLVFAATSLLAVAAVGYLEINGGIQNAYSGRTRYADVLDIVVIVGITGLTIHLLADGLLKSLALARDNEKALRAETDHVMDSEKRYRALFEGAHDAIFIMKGDRLQQCNDKALLMFGCGDRSEIVGHSPWDFSPPRQPDGRDSRERAMQLIGATLGGEPQNFYWKHRRKDGSLFDADVSLNPLHTGAEHFIQALIRDVSARKQAEDELRESEQRFSILSGATFEGIAVSDRGRIIEINEQLAAMLGYKRSEMMDLTVESFVAPESLGLVMQHIRSGSEDPYEHLALRKDGSTLPVEIRAKSLPYRGRSVRVTAIRDVAERKRAQERIQEQARLLDVARDAIIVRDVQDRLLYLNRAAQDLYGWTFEEARSLSPEAMIAGSDLEKFRREKEAFVARGEWNGELRHRTKDGRELIIQTHWTLVRDDQGKPAARLIINRDITEQRALEAQFRRAQRLESLGTLAGGIAHDLNNVLTPITMSLALLDRKVTDPALKRYIASLESSARRGTDIVKQVLLFARGSEKEFAPQQLRYIIREITTFIQETFPRNIELATDVAGDLTFVQGDATQLHQVLMNLCVNARDAMPGGGRLSITASNVRLSGADARMMLRGHPGEYAMVSVTDTGTGIPKEIQERIFEPFFTTKDPGKGTGLGLSTVYGIVKGHNGFINLTSEPGRGAIFEVYLPAVRHREEIARSERSADPPSGHGEVILVVDDEQAVLEIAREILEIQGYRVLTASSGEEAVSAFGAAPGGSIRLVLTDVNMPGMDGLAAVEEIRKMDRDIRVIVASGIVADLNPVNMRELNIHGYLTKPYTSERMLSMIHELLA